MKKITSIFTLILSVLSIAFLQAQAPQGINYQAVIRDVNGKELVDGAKINLKFSIIDAGTAVYSETHSKVVTKLGLYNVLIGKGTTTDDFSTIKWSNPTSKSIKIETDVDNDNLFDTESTSQLVSVPYALFANAANERQKLKIVGSKLFILDGDGKEINNVTIPTANYSGGDGILVVDGAIINTKPDKIVTITGTGGVLVTGTYPNFTVYSDKYVAGSGIGFVSKGSGTYEITNEAKLTLNGNQLTLSPNGNSVTLPTSGGGSTYSAGTNITIANNVISSKPTLSILNNQLSISGGNSVTFPSSSGGNQWILDTSTDDYSFTNGTGNVLTDKWLIADKAIGIKNAGKYYGFLGVNTSVKAGYLNLFGENGKLNFLAGSLSGYPNNGAISCWDSQEKQKTLMAVHSNGTGVISTWGKTNSTPLSTTVIIGCDNISNPNSLDAGVVENQGPLGQNLVTMSHLFDYPNNGFLGINRSSTTNTPKIGLLLNSSNKAHFYMASSVFAEAAITIDAFDDANFFCSGLKQFRVPHPNNPEKDIRYTCIEGPEAAMYVRGTAKLVNGVANVELPEHFRLLAGNKSVTVIVTPLSADSEGLAVLKKSKDGFQVAELRRGTGNYDFDWEIKAIRSKYEDNYQVIGDREKAPKSGGFSEKYKSELNNAKISEK